MVLLKKYLSLTLILLQVFIPASSYAGRKNKTFILEAHENLSRLFQKRIELSSNPQKGKSAKKLKKNAVAILRQFDEIQTKLQPMIEEKDKDAILYLAYLKTFMGDFETAKTDILPLAKEEFEPARTLLRDIRKEQKKRAKPEREIERITSVESAEISEEEPENPREALIRKAKSLNSNNKESVEAAYEMITALMKEGNRADARGYLERLMKCGQTMYSDALLKGLYLENENDISGAVCVFRKDENGKPQISRIITDPKKFIAGVKRGSFNDEEIRQGLMSLSRKKNPQYIDGLKKEGKSNVALAYLYGCYLLECAVHSKSKTRKKVISEAFETLMFSARGGDKRASGRLKTLCEQEKRRDLKEQYDQFIQETSPPPPVVTVQAKTVVDSKVENWFERANQLDREGDVQGAIEAFSRVELTTQVSDLYKRAWFCAGIAKKLPGGAQEWRDKAIVFYKSAMKKDAEKTTLYEAALYRLGKLYWASNAVKLAEEMFLQSLERVQTKSCYQLGRLYLALGKMQEGLQLLNLAAQAGVTKAHFRMGEFFENKGQLEAACYVYGNGCGVRNQKCLERLEALFGMKSRYAALNLAKGYLLTKKYVGLEEILQDLDKIDHPENPAFISFMRGRAAFDQGRLDEAKNHFSKAASLNHPEALAFLGNVFLAQGFTKETKECWTKSLEKQPHNGELQFNLATLQYEDGDYHNGFISLLNSSLLGRDEPVAFLTARFEQEKSLRNKTLYAANLGLLYCKRSMLKEARQYLEYAFQHGSDHIKEAVSFTFVDLCLGEENLEGAQAFCKECLKFNEPNFTGILVEWFFRGQAASATSHEKASAGIAVILLRMYTPQAVRIILDQVPVGLYFIPNLSDLKLDLNAITFSRCSKLLLNSLSESNIPLATTYLAILKMKSPQANEELNKIIKQESSSRMIFNYGVTLLISGHLDEAIPYLQRAEQHVSGDDQLRCDICFTLTRAYFAKGDQESTLKYLRIAKELGDQKFENFLKDSLKTPSTDLSMKAQQILDGL